MRILVAILIVGALGLAQGDIPVSVHGSEDMGWKIPPVAKNGIFRSAPVVRAGEGRSEQDSLALA